MTEAGNPHGYPTRNWMDEEAAAQLAYQIRKHWAQRGYIVDTWLVRVKSSETISHKAGGFAIRSDMINGMPSRRMGALQ